jgi:hypothetical protein
MEAVASGYDGADYCDGKEECRYRMQPEYQRPIPYIHSASLGRLRAAFSFRGFVSFGCGNYDRIATGERRLDWNRE